MENSSSSSNDELPLMTESLNFDETTFSVLPVIIDSQTVSLTEFEHDPLEGEGDTLLSVPFTPTVITLEDGTQATIISDSLDASGVVLDDKGELVLPEDTEEEDVGVPVIVTEDSSPVLEAMQMEVGTVAYIYSQPQEGCQVLELDDGTIAYITLKEPKEPTLPKEKASPQVEAVTKKQKTFLCPREGCGRLYTSAHHLKVHERTHTGSRPYQCTEEGCSKAFSTDYSRKAHVRTHTGEKPYSCPETNCAKSFKTSGDLQKHIRTHTGERPFTCPVEGCNRSFTTSNIRKVHIRTHTGERPYVCSSCDKAFASATNYKNHIRIHSGEKPYCCNVAGCNRRFTEYSSLYKHHMVHTQEKPYQCSMCGRSYRQVSTLTVHKRTSHGVIEADDGTEIVLGNVFTQKVLNNTNTTMIGADTRKIKTVKTVSSKLLNDGEYIGLLDSEGSIQRISSEQLFIIEDIREHLKALQHIQDPDDEELKAALDPLQEQ